MSFMNAEITEKMDWVCVDGNGMDYFPADLIDLDALRAALDADDDYASAFDLVKDYTETHDHEQILDISIVHGYGVRSSAAGYMDCTSWSVYKNKREAERAAREEQRQCEGLD
jgi:hypothetical protein